MLKRTALPALLLLTVAACSSAGTGPSPSPSPGPAETPRATPTAVPGQGGSGNTGGGGTDPGSGGGSGGGTGGDPGTGILPPGITFPLPPAPDQALIGDANYLEPVAGLLNVRPVNVQLVRAAISDGDTFVDLRWWSGVEACNQLDSVKVARDDAARTIHLTVSEGSPAGDMMCIELAELHATAVNLGALASGTWTISAEGDAPAIKLDVP